MIRGTMRDSSSP
uniref:Uncharacterized protein MANES_17G074400 n=1 Tax=Rhizophora mucronata TaxID=61149 RepID=A0A2P2N5T3_RHIMU